MSRYGAQYQIAVVSSQELGPWWSGIGPYRAAYGGSIDDAKIGLMVFWHAELFSYPWSVDA